MSTPYATRVRTSTADCGVRDEARGPSSGWALVAIAAVLYGSLLPFEIDLSALSLRNAFGLSNLGFPVPGLDDVILNLMVYVPVGFALATCGRRHIGRPSSCFLAIMLLGALVSTAAEALQTGIELRCASWIDVGLNVIGTALGATLGNLMHDSTRRTLHALRRSLSDRPSATLSSVLTIGLVLYAIVPFDFVTNTQRLHASFLQARWSLLEARSSSATPSPYPWAIDQLAGAMWFAALGYLLAVAAIEQRLHRGSVCALPDQDQVDAAHRRNHRRLGDPGALPDEKASHTRAFAFVASCAQGLTLAVVIECLQLFTRSHVFDLLALTTRAVAVGLAAWYAAFVTGRDWKAGHHTNLRRLIPTRGLAAIAILHTIALVVLAVLPHNQMTADFDWAKIYWLPFKAHWLCPFPQMLSDVLGTLVNYAILGAVVGITLTRLGIDRAWVKTGSFVLLLATLIETVQVQSTSHTADVTDPILALVAVIAISRLYVRMRLSPPLHFSPAT